MKPWFRSPVREVAYFPRCDGKWVSFRRFADHPSSVHPRWLHSLAPLVHPVFGKSLWYSETMLNYSWAWRRLAGFDLNLVSITDPSKHGFLSTRLSLLIQQSKPEMADSQIPLLCSAAKKTEACLINSIKIPALLKSYYKLTDILNKSTQANMHMKLKRI